MSWASKVQTRVFSGSTWDFLRFNLRFFQFEAIAHNELSIKNRNQSFFRFNPKFSQVQPEIYSVWSNSWEWADHQKSTPEFFQVKLQTNKITVINLWNTWKNLKLKTDKKPSCFQTWKNHRFQKYPKPWKVDLQAEINSPPDLACLLVFSFEVTWPVS